MAKSIARQLATAALWVRIQTSLKNQKWATSAKKWPTHSSPPKKYIEIIVRHADQRLRIRIRMISGLPDPDPLVRGTDPDPDPAIVKEK